MLHLVGYILEQNVINQSRPCALRESIWWSVGIGPLILNLGIRGKRSDSRPNSFTPGNIAPVPIK